MWQPEPGWEPLASGMGSSTLGVWRVTDRAGEWVVKRLARPLPDDAVELSTPAHYAYWRREADAALAGVPGPGLRMPPVRRVDEDADGVALWTAAMPRTELSGPFVATALGRMAGARFPEGGWLCRDLLRGRLARMEQHDGWKTLRRTSLADLAALLWERRHRALQRLDHAPVGLSHGDPTPQNLLTRSQDDVVAVDWAVLGVAPLGTDLGYYALTARESFEVLLDAYLEGVRSSEASASVDDVAHVARVMAVYTAFSRAEWALTRVATGEGDLKAKYRHPAVAPYLRGLQRQFPQVEALLAEWGDGAPEARS